MILMNMIVRQTETVRKAVYRNVAINVFAWCILLPMQAEWHESHT